MIKPLMHPVRYRAVVIQRREHLLDTNQYVVDAGNVQEGFLLTGEGCLGQVFSRGR